MELDLISNSVLNCLEVYNEVDFVLIVLNGISLDYIKSRTRTQLSDVWKRILRSKVVNKFLNLRLLAVNIPESPLICSKCQSCQTSLTFNEEPQIICELQIEDDDFIRKPRENIWVNSKITQLENQVDDLTEQVAKLKLQILHEQSRQRMTMTNSIPSIIITNGGAPPPPPPPMPSFSYVNPHENLKIQINKNKTRNSLGSSETGPIKTSTPLITLADVMKGAKNIKLKKTARSPGGTPIRPPKSIESGMDLTAILARHLKRRHDLLNPCDSPRNTSDTGSENSFQISSPEGPECSYGKIRRRSKILMLSPLREINS